jgi:hypothetical protein
MFAPATAKSVRTSVEYRGLREYARVTANLVYQRFTNVIPIDSGEKKLLARLETAIIKDYGEFGGGIDYEKPQFFEVPVSASYQKGGLEMNEAQFSDNGIYGKVGVEGASDWAFSVMAEAARWPQAQSIALLRSGTSSTFLTGPAYGKTIGNCYDGAPLFSFAHPYNWQMPSVGYFCNLFTGGSLVDGRGIDVNHTYTVCPGFCPLAGPFGTASAEISLAAAFDNLWKTIAYIRTIKMPNGITPRYLEPTGIICGPKLAKNVELLTNAQFINMQSGSSGGATDIKGTITRMGLEPQIVLPELGGNTDIDADEDYDWYLICEAQARESRYGAVIFAPREPFNLRMYAAVSGSEGINLALAEANLVKWITQGRSGVTVGLPQFIFKNQTTRD